MVDLHIMLMFSLSVLPHICTADYQIRQGQVPNPSVFSMYWSPIRFAPVTAPSDQLAICSLLSIADKLLCLSHAKT